MTTKKQKSQQAAGDLHTIWPLLESGISDDLISQTAVSRLQTIMSHLPLLSGGGFECRLDGSDDQVDIAMRLTEADGGFDLLQKPFATFPKPSKKADVQTWNKLRAFAQARNDVNSDLYHAIKEAWFEFDLAKDQDSLTPPNFFFKLEEHFARPPKLGPTAEERRQKTVTLIQTALTHLGLNATDATIETLHKCLQHRPASSNLPFVGLMLARSQPGFRITLGNMPLNRLTPYLKKIGWPHNHQHLVPLIRHLKLHTKNVQLNIDIADTPQPKLGLELSFHKKEHEQQHWENFFYYNNFRGLSNSAKTTAVLNWPTHLHRNDNWPEALQGQYNHFVRNINHIKLSYDPTAYQFQPLPVPQTNTSAIMRKRQAQGLPNLNAQAKTAVTAKAYIAFHYTNTFPHPAYWTND